MSIVCVMDGLESDPTRVQGLYNSCNILFYALYVWYAIGIHSLLMIVDTSLATHD